MPSSKGEGITISGGKMKRVFSLLFCLIICLTLIIGCSNNKEDENREPRNEEAIRDAQIAFDAYEEAYGKGAVAEGSIIRVKNDMGFAWFRYEKGEISYHDASIKLEVRDTHVEVTHEDLDTIPETTFIYLQTGSVLPEGYSISLAMEQAQKSLELYQVPPVAGDPPRVMPDGAIFDIEVNGEHFYVMCKDDKIKDESADYKKLIESDEYYLDEADFFSFTIYLYFKNDPEAEAKAKATQIAQSYLLPGESDDAKGQTIPDGSIIVVKHKDKTYYFMVENTTIKDQSKKYKELIKSDDYKKVDAELDEGIRLYIKK